MVDELPNPQLVSWSRIYEPSTVTPSFCLHSSTTWWVCAPRFIFLVEKWKAVSNATEVPPKKSTTVDPICTRKNSRPTKSSMQVFGVSKWLPGTWWPSIYTCFYQSFGDGFPNQYHRNMLGVITIPLHPSKTRVFFRGRNSASVRCLVGLTSQDGGCLLTSDMSSIKAAPVKYSSTVIGPKYCPGTAGWLSEFFCGQKVGHTRSFFRCF